MDSNPAHFSALSFHGNLASGIITSNLEDGPPQDFYFMTVPSIQGCSGSAVYYGIKKSIMMGGPDRTYLIGVISGTYKDNTGGKMAMITPFSYLKHWDIQIKQ
jgi:hypothetical protein